MANASKIVSDCQQALGKGDFAAARKLVHDNLLFQGPIDTFHSPEPYFEALKKLHPIIQRIDMKKIFADGNDVWSCTTWLQTLLSAPRLFANGIRSKAIRSPLFESCLTPGRSLQCSGSKQDRSPTWPFKS